MLLEKLFESGVGSIVVGIDDGDLQRHPPIGDPSLVEERCKLIGQAVELCDVFIGQPEQQWAADRPDLQAEDPLVEVERSAVPAILTARHRPGGRLIRACLTIRLTGIGRDAHVDGSAGLDGGGRRAPAGVVAY